MWIFFVLFILCIILMQPHLQIGGGDGDDYDPYRNFRFWKIIDFFRWLWFTR